MTILGIVELWRRRKPSTQTDGYGGRSAPPCRQPSSRTAADCDESLFVKRRASRKAITLRGLSGTGPKSNTDKAVRWCCECLMKSAVATAPPRHIGGCISGDSETSSHACIPRGRQDSHKQRFS